jgi:RNA-directed DNA polymerase
MQGASRRRLDGRGAAERQERQQGRFYQRSLFEGLEEKELNSFLTGWVTYFRFAKAKSVLAELGSWVRHKLRCVRLKQRKRAKSIADFLHGLGVPRNRCWTTAACGKGWWRMAESPAAHEGMNLAWFTALG